MIESIIARIVDLDKTIQRDILRDLFVTEDKQAHTFKIHITRSGADVDLTNATVTGYFMRYKDKVSIPLEGNVDGSTAVLTLNEGCYALRTMFGVTVCVAAGGKKHVVYFGEGQMLANRTDSIVDTEGVIPSLEDIIAQYEAMAEGTEAANTAASSANTAAGNANTAAASANSATANANSAAERANRAATVLENAPVPAGSVVTYQAGTNATTPPTGTWLADVPTVPQGQYLWTRTVQSFTNGDPVISYSVARQGMDGSGSVSSVNGVAPDASGNVQIEVGGKVQTVNGVSPDEDGNVQLAPDNVGALPADGTAANASLLGGKAPEYYVQPRNLLDNSDFRNPVNQRGLSTYNTAGYTIDRWYARVGTADNGNSVGISTDGIVFTVGSIESFVGFIQQVGDFRVFAGKTITLAMKVKSNTVQGMQVTLSNGASGQGVGGRFATNAVPLGDSISVVSIALPDTAANAYLTASIECGAYPKSEGQFIVEWAALYEGTYTADTLPPYVPKGYSAELAECLRYFYRPSTPDLIFNGFAVSNAATLFCYTAAVMRTAPTVTGTVEYIRANGTNKTDYTGTVSLDYFRPGANVVYIKLVGDTGFELYDPLLARISNFEMSADL